MPAAAVIPAPRAYIKVVAVKKLVVELPPARAPVFRGMRAGVLREITLSKRECSKQARCLNLQAWNNKTGQWFYFVGYKPS